MEKKVVDIKEALLFLLKKENLVNFLCYLVYYIPLILLIFLGVSLSTADKINPLVVVGVILSALLTIPCCIIASGYIPLYQHDRALDKNAVLRNPFTCIVDCLLISIKAAVAVQIVYLVFYLVYLFLVILSFIPLIIPTIGIVITVLLVIALTIAYIVSYVVCLFKLIPNFSKDLNFVSYINIIEAFKLTKGVRYGFGAIGVYFLIFLAAMLVSFLSIVVVALFISFKGNPVIPAIIMSILSLFGFLYASLYGANMFGQYTYNAIEQNMKVEPETLPKEINKDKTAIIVAIALWVVFVILSLLGAVLNLALSTAIDKQSNIVSTTKIKKAVSSYDVAISIYMVTNETKSAEGIAKDNCRNISEYFRPVEQNGCDFVTRDGVYWQIFRDGSAKISDDKNNPTKSVMVGVCPDGKVNCKSLYPEAYDLRY